MEFRTGDGDEDDDDDDEDDDDDDDDDDDVASSELGYTLFCLRLGAIFHVFPLSDPTKKKCTKKHTIGFF